MKKIATNAAQGGSRQFLRFHLYKSIVPTFISPWICGDTHGDDRADLHEDAFKFCFSSSRTNVGDVKFGFHRNLFPSSSCMNHELLRKCSSVEGSRGRKKEKAQLDAGQKLLAITSVGTF